MGYLTSIFYSDERLINLLNRKNESNEPKFIGLNSLDNDNIQITVHKMVCLSNYMEVYNYNIVTKELIYVDKYVLHLQHSFDAYRNSYTEVIEG